MTPAEEGDLLRPVLQRRAHILRCVWPLADDDNVLILPDNIRDVATNTTADLALVFALVRHDNLTRRA